MAVCDVCDLLLHGGPHLRAHFYIQPVSVHCADGTPMFDIAGSIKCVCVCIYLCVLIFVCKVAP